MTLEQALAFKINGKALRDMSQGDWRQWLKRMRAEHAMLEAMDERDLTDETQQRFHAIADRLGDLIAALGHHLLRLTLSRNLLPMRCDYPGRAPRAPLKGGIVVQSFAGNLPLCRSIPFVTLDAPACSRSSQDDDGNNHPVLPHAVAMKHGCCCAWG